jgi:hypothetical protein
VGIPYSETASGAARKAVFLVCFSSGQTLGGNLYALLLYSLISSWQDLCTNTQDNKLEAVQPCVQVWQSFSCIRKQEIMLTCPWIRHICLTHILVLQGAPAPASTQCGVPITILHIWKECPCSDKSQTFSWSWNVAWYPRRWHMVCGWPCLLNWPCSVLLFESFYMYWCFKGFSRPYAACLTVISELNIYCFISGCYPPFTYTYIALQVHNFV